MMNFFSFAHAHRKDTDRPCWGSGATIVLWVVLCGACGTNGPVDGELACCGDSGDWRAVGDSFGIGREIDESGSWRVVKDCNSLDEGMTEDGGAGGEGTMDAQSACVAVLEARYENAEACGADCSAWHEYLGPSEWCAKRSGLGECLVSQVDACVNAEYSKPCGLPMGDLCSQTPECFDAGTCGPW